jgi:hypothetical protein
MRELMIDRSMRAGFKDDSVVFITPFHRKEVQTA